MEKEIICSQCKEGKMRKKEDGYWYCDSCEHTVAAIVSVEKDEKNIL